MSSDTTERHAPRSRPATKTKPRSGLKGKLVFLVPVLLMGAGYGVGSSFLKGSTSESTSGHEVHEHYPETIDEAIASGDYEATIQRIQKDLKAAGKATKSPLRFREALCQELNGDFAAAAILYAQVGEGEPGESSDHEEPTPCRIVARLGQARCWMRSQRAAEAKAMVARLLLSSGNILAKHPTLLAEILHTRALLVLQEIPRLESPHPLRPEGMASAPRNIDLAQHLEWAGALPKVQHSAHGGTHDGPSADHGHADSHSTGDAAPEPPHSPAKKAEHLEKKSAAETHDSHDKPAEKSKAPAPARHDDHAPAKQHSPEHPVAFLLEDHPAEHHEPAKKELPKSKAAIADEHKLAEPAHPVDHHPPLAKEKAAAKPVEPKPTTEHGPKPEQPHGEPKKEPHHADEQAPAHPKSDHAAPDAHSPAVHPVVEVFSPFVIRKVPQLEQCIVTGRPRPATVPEVLTDLARATGLQLKIAPAALENLSGRSVAPHVRGLILADVLDCLTEPYEVSWMIDGTVLELKPHISDPAMDRQHARRLLKRAVNASSEHPWLALTLIDLGHLDIADRDWPAAATWFSRVVKDFPLRSEATPAGYNLALAFVHSGELSRAREHFLNVADRDLNGKWASLAFYWAGRTYLDSGNPVAAEKLFRQAITAGFETPGATAGALGLCVALYQQGEIVAGHAVLRPHQKRLKEEGFRATAAFLDAYGRQRLASSPQKTGENEDLLLATMNSPDVLALGPASSYLLAQTCREQSFPARFQTILERSMENLRGPLAVKMLLELAEYSAGIGERLRARDRFQAVAAVDQNESGQAARLRLAEMENEDSRYDAALKQCRDLISLGNKDGKVLKQMGLAYEGKKDFARAAQSFAGVVPQ